MSEVSEGHRERVLGLVYKGEIFELMVQHPIVVEITEAIVGSDMTLGGFSAHILHPGATNMVSKKFIILHKNPTDLLKTGISSNFRHDQLDF